MSTDRRERRIVLVDVDGQPTDDPKAAVAGEVTELTAEGRPTQRRRFFLTREELPWLPVGEAAFLLWVLVALVAVWAVVAVGLRLT
jgi:hypothetical protein